MSVIMSKNELYDLYNILGSSLIKYENYEDKKDEYSEETLTTIKTTEGIINKIRDAYQGLKDGANATLKLHVEESLIVVKCLMIDIKVHEDKIGSEDDPTSHNAEHAYNMSNLKKRIQEHFREKLHDLVCSE